MIRRSSSDGTTPLSYFANDGGAVDGGVDLALQLNNEGGNLDCVNWTNVELAALGRASAGFSGALGDLAAGLADASNAEAESRHEANSLDVSETHKMFDQNSQRQSSVWLSEIRSF